MCRTDITSPTPQYMPCKSRTISIVSATIHNLPGQTSPLELMPNAILVVGNEQLPVFVRCFHIPGVFANNCGTFHPLMSCRLSWCTLEVWCGCCTFDMMAADRACRQESLGNGGVDGSGPYTVLLYLRRTHWNAWYPFCLCLFDSMFASNQVVPQVLRLVPSVWSMYERLRLGLMFNHSYHYFVDRPVQSRILNTT